MNFKTGNETVDKIGQMHLEGNVIPHTWYDMLKLKNGKPDLVAIVLLSEIVYWYRPTYVKDEKTGALRGVKKRFKADLLQRSYDSFSEQFGLTKRQVKDACKRLEDAGLIRRVFRTIQSGNTRLGNVLFIQLFANELMAMTFKSTPYDDETSEVLRSNVTPMTIKRQTNTEITTKTTTEITTDKKDNVALAPSLPFSDVVDYLNEKAGTKYKASSKKTQNLIKARFNEGFTLDDFKTVIDKKTAEWLTDQKMNQYLRPETLFGTKFESYLNQKGGSSNEKARDAKSFAEDHGLPF